LRRERIERRQRATGSSTERRKEDYRKVGKNKGVKEKTRTNHTIRVQHMAISTANDKEPAQQEKMCSEQETSDQGQHQKNEQATRVDTKKMLALT